MSARTSWVGGVLSGDRSAFTGSPAILALTIPVAAILGACFYVCYMILQSSAHQADVAQVQQTDADLRALGQELQHVLAVVVLDRGGVQDWARRQPDLAALVDLVADVHTHACAPLQAEIGRLHTQLRLAQTAVLTFVARLDQVQQDMAVVLGMDGLAVLAWAWQRRGVLEMDGAQLVAALPPHWQAAARVMVHAWETAGRASSAVENWHSILRPHLPCIAPCCQDCWRCWRSGIIIVCSVVASIKAPVQCS